MSRKITDTVSPAGRIKKMILQRIRYKKGYDKCIMIMGCQRSGTTLISHLFNQLEYCSVFGEFSILSNKDSSGLRLNDTAEIINIFERSHAPLIVCKPLVESQNANLLLENIPNSKVLWVYRNYRDVVASDIKKFKETAGRGNILPLINNDQSNWRCEHSSDETRHIIKSLYSDKLSSADCAALFWYARNVLFFEQGFDKNSSAYLWNYENFISSPTVIFNDLLDDLQLDKPTKNIHSDVFDDSVNKASNLTLHKDVEALCDALYQKLNTAEM
tara:strand:+ start:2407 stop:3225 length:819 start_codon:yes stop_codon:yes gene_type:complete